ncbi:MAG: aminotransferase class III-fold pyridoxal phosphate-dependent enzyme [Anaerolineae bacterium]
MEPIPDGLKAEFARRFPTSLRRYNEALEVFPGGVTHAARHMKPFPIYISHAQGAYKWDLDGNRFIDYWMGHGALLLGHNHPAIVQAVTGQIQRGTHYSASHELEITWGRWVQRLIPSAERVRFVNSGTEAVMMALRLARGFTGRNKIIRFAGHFHGWHDLVVLGARPPFDVPTSVGIPDATLAHIICLPPNDIHAVAQVLGEDDDVAGVLLEPAGGSNATIPTQPGFLAALRDLCTAHQVILIFDEVITGFRYAPGGAQDYFGVTPDLSALAKILAGGLPGGAVAGRADIMALLDLSGDPHVNRYQRISHPGTFNANPLSAVAGIATLEIAATGEPQEWSGHLTSRLIQGMNDIMRAARAPGCVYGDRGGFHLLVGQGDFYPNDVEHQIAQARPERLSRGMGRLAPLVRAAFLLEGVDAAATSGRLSAAHTENDIEHTLSSFERVLARLKQWEVW